MDGNRLLSVEQGGTLRMLFPRAALSPNCEGGALGLGFSVPFWVAAHLDILYPKPHNRKS